MNRKYWFPRTASRIVVALLAFAVLTGGVAADHEEDEDGDTIINIDLDQVVSALNDLLEAISGWDEKIEQILIDVFFGPFRDLANALVDLVTYVITSYPTVHPSTDVEEVHRLTFIVAVSLAGLVFAATGILYITGPLFGISYYRVRLILPRTVLALVFAAVAPRLLQYAVDLSYLSTAAFQPADGDIVGAVRLTGELILVALIDSSLLLAVAVLFLIRDVYILFAVSISPLIALAWSLPYVKGYADSLIGAFWAALLIGPLDMLVFRLAFSFIQEQGGRTPRWLWSIATLTLLLVVPYLVFSASQSMIGTGRRLIPSRNSGSKKPEKETGEDGSTGIQTRERGRRNTGRSRNRAGSNFRPGRKR